MSILVVEYTATMLALRYAQMTYVVPQFSLLRLYSSKSFGESTKDDPDAGSMDPDTSESCPGSDPVSDQNIPYAPFGLSNKLNRPSSSRSRFRRNLSPSQRLGSLLPEDYWKSQDHTVVKSVESLQKPLVPAAEKRKPDSHPEDAKHQLKAFECGKTILITVIKKWSPLEPYKRFARIISNDEQTLSLYSFGSVELKDIIGKRPPLWLKSSNGNILLFTHPSLEEYMECLQKLPVTLTPKVYIQQ